jgi:hypothetical protein
VGESGECVKILTSVNIHNDRGIGENKPTHL